MIVISNFEVTKGYQVWKKAFESNEAMRQKDNVKVLAAYILYFYRDQLVDFAKS